MPPIAATAMTAVIVTNSVTAIAVTTMTPIGASISTSARVRAPRCTKSERRAVWVEPVYRTVYDHVWVDAVYRDDSDRVWVPDRFEDRDVVTYDRGRRSVRHEHVLVEPAHDEIVHRQVLITPAHWEDVARQECVTPGHWEYQTERVAIDRPDRDGFDFGFRIGR